jgi:hypothetical protein
MDGKKQKGAPDRSGADGRQYVIDGDGQRVYGVWYYPPDEPAPNVIVNAPAHR